MWCPVCPNLYSVKFIDFYNIPVINESLDKVKITEQKKLIQIFPPPQKTVLASKKNSGNL